MLGGGRGVADGHGFGRLPIKFQVHPPQDTGWFIEAFQATEGHLSIRLLAALEAGQAAGGDRRGMQSAAMVIVKEDGGVWLNNDVVLRLQVDDAVEPIAELRRLVEIAARQRERIRGR